MKSNAYLGNRYSSDLPKLSESAPWPVVALLVSLVLPVELSFYIGDLLITATRLILLIMALPSIYNLFKHSKLMACDYLLFGFVLWIFISFMVNHGVAKAIESGGVLSLEILIGYLISRSYLENLEQLRSTVKLIVFIVILIMPFVVLEAMIGEHFVHDFFSSISGFYYPLAYEERLGLTRAYGPFSHPILLGVFCSALIGLVWYGLGNSGKLIMTLRVGALVLATLTSLSSAPILLMIFQFFAIIWNRIAIGFKQRWQLIVGSFIALYVFLLFWSAYSPMMIILSKITLNPATSYYRMLIWDYGSAEVLRHPIFGIGLSDWLRPAWMIQSSIDNFWLKQAMQFGLPGVVLISVCTIYIIKRVSNVSGEAVSEIYQLMCRGWVVSMISLVMVALSVDFFGSIHVFFYFMLGMGAALINIYPLESK